MIGSLIGIGTGLFSSIFGGIGSAQAAREAQARRDASRRRTQTRMQENQDWFNRRYNEDYTQTADAQRVLTKSSDLAKQMIAAARGRQAVMGGTELSMAPERAQANTLVSDTLGNIAEQSTAAKNAVENRYFNTRDKLESALQDIDRQDSEAAIKRAENISEAASAGMSAGMKLLDLDYQSKLATGKGLFSNLFGAKKTFL